VLATDIDPRLIDADGADVIAHDVLRDPPPGSFDLVHARLLVEHLPDRPAVLATLAGAVAPGGRLVIESLEASGVTADPAAGADATLFVDCSARLAEFLRGLGLDPFYGHTLCGCLTGAGLADVDAAVLSAITRGGATIARFWQLTWQLLGPAVLAAGVLTTGELDRYLALHDDPAMVWQPPAIVAAWGTATR
jgi:SAM-dependent methyltransferase